ncbi:MAG TPA: ATP-binding protein [Nitrospira sp.]|nr:ATP-binding protein [Nitrospira sp.]
MSTPQLPQAVGASAQPSGFRFVSLRTKFVAFFSLILIVACSTLTWYFIETRRASMIEDLKQLGTILLTSVVNNGQFRYGGLIAEDRATLRQFTESLIAVDDVVYVVIRGADHMILAQQNKLVKESSGSLTFSQERRFYPDEQMALEVAKTHIAIPRMTPVQLSKEDMTLVPSSADADRFWILSPFTQHLYDFSLPVFRRPLSDPSLSPLPHQFDDSQLDDKGHAKPAYLGMVQIGVSDAQVRNTLAGLVRNVLILTAALIGAGILGAQLLVQRVTIPLRNLAGVARQLTEGRTPSTLTPSTNDEVGQLTQTFNLMTRTLHERNLAITTNMDTIRRQISQLTTVHQTSAAIASTLDLHQLLDTVLQLLMSNLKFSRMVLMLRHEDRDTAYVAQVAGVTDEVAEAARFLTVPIKEDETLMAELMLHAKPVLVHDIETVRKRMHPSILELAARVGVTSFACVPLQSHNQTLGFLAGDRGSQPCSREDLDILLTIAGHVASAIDNARTYAHLAQLTQHLEYRIEARTKELSAANQLLQEHDHRRSVFFSVASHELRTPMTAIRSFADNMLDGVAGPLTERQTTYLNRIGHNLDRLTRIINQLLDWSRIDLKREMMNMEPLCVRQIAALVVESNRTVAAEKGITLGLTFAEQLPRVQGDRDKMEQIFWNLVGNAIKFTPRDGTVTVGITHDEREGVRVCVADTGCGIAPEHLHRVFEEFSRVPSSVPSSQGAQLGLFITKNLVAMHGGTIWVESTLGRGTRFYITLPPTALEPERAEIPPEMQ